MGVMNYTLVGSDNAASLASDIFAAIIKRLNRQMKHPGNEYNTQGFEDVSLFIRQVLMKAPDQIRIFGTDSEDLRQITEECINRYQEIRRSLTEAEWRSTKERNVYRKYIGDSIRDLRKFRRILK